MDEGESSAAAADRPPLDDDMDVGVSVGVDTRDHSTTIQHHTDHPMSQTMTAGIRSPMAIFTPLDLDRMARRVIDAIDAESGSRKAHRERVARLYAVARDIQVAGDQKVTAATVWEYVKFIGAVVANRYFMGQWKREGVR